jgi:glyoxylase-like metal-dependent hydrolase (beta-lactamase superfamily II)
MRDPLHLPAGVTVFERGWLSSNNVLIVGEGSAALVDSGYCSHASQTLALVDAALGASPLGLLVNTHLHSDHCGGNAALQARHSTLRTLIPPGQFDAVVSWDPEALSYAPTGQSCPRFRADGVLAPGTSVRLGALDWEVHAAPGHDVHSVVLFEPRSRTLISADALWQRGFGVIFGELEGERAFDAASQTLDLIEGLAPAVIVPGHGPAFTGVSASLSVARQRLDAFAGNPAKHAKHAAKVLLKFKLLEQGAMSMAQLTAWASRTRYFEMIRARWCGETPLDCWLQELIGELQTSGAARIEGLVVMNC